jgi:hypothetical protein
MNEFEKQVLALKCEASYWFHRTANWTLPIMAVFTAWFLFVVL